MSFSAEAAHRRPPKRCVFLMFRCVFSPRRCVFFSDDRDRQVSAGLVMSCCFLMSAYAFFHLGDAFLSGEISDLAANIFQPGFTIPTP